MWQNVLTNSDQILPNVTNCDKYDKLATKNMYLTDPLEHQQKTQSHTQEEISSNITCRCSSVRILSLDPEPRIEWLSSFFEVFALLPPLVAHYWI